MYKSNEHFCQETKPGKAATVNSFTDLKWPLWSRVCTDCNIWFTVSCVCELFYCECELEGEPALEDSSHPNSGLTKSPQSCSSTAPADVPQQECHERQETVLPSDTPRDGGPLSVCLSHVVISPSIGRWAITTFKFPFGTFRRVSQDGETDLIILETKCVCLPVTSVRSLLSLHLTFPTFPQQS